MLFNLPMKCHLYNHYLSISKGSFAFVPLIIKSVDRINDRVRSCEVNDTISPFEKQRYTLLRIIIHGSRLSALSFVSKQSRLQTGLRFVG